MYRILENSYQPGRGSAGRGSAGRGSAIKSNFSSIYREEGCKAMAYVLNIDINDTDCEKCPFPFCVEVEAGQIIRYLRYEMTSIMNQLGNSCNEIAQAAGVSRRTINRYMKYNNDNQCAQCNIVHSANIVCRSNVFSVAKRGTDYIIILNRHGTCRRHEQSVVYDLIDYAFPCSKVQPWLGIHDHWIISRVELLESQRFDNMCVALNRYFKYMVTIGEPV